MASGSLVPVLHATLSGSHLESTTSASSKTASYKVQTNSAATGATALTPPDGDIMSALLSRRVDQSLDPAQRQAASAALDIYIKTFSAVRGEMAATQVKNGKRKKRMSLVEAFEDEEQDKNLRCFYIPGINLFYTSIFEDPPSVLDLDRMLSHLSLLAALMLTIAMSLPMEFDFGEFEAARERFSTTQYRNYDTFESLYIEAMGYTTAAASVLGAAVSIIVVFSAFGRLDTDWTDEARREWWKLARWPVNGSFVLSKYLSEGAAREWSTVVSIFIPPPSWFHCLCHVLLYFKTPKPVFFLTQ